MVCDGVGGGEGGMTDFMLFGGFGDRQTDKRTLVVVESLNVQVVVG